MNTTNLLRTSGMRKKQGGYTLPELAVGFAFVAILLIGAFAVIPQISFKMNTQELTKEVNNIRQETIAWKGYGRASFTDIDIKTLCSATRKALPTGVCGASSDGASANPFGGDYVLNVNPSNNGRFNIQITKIPADKVDIIADQFAPGTADECESSDSCLTTVVSTDTITLTYGG